MPWPDPDVPSRFPTLNHLVSSSLPNFLAFLTARSSGPVCGRTQKAFFHSQRCPRLLSLNASLDPFCRQTTVRQSGGWGGMSQPGVPTFLSCVKKQTNQQHLHYYTSIMNMDLVLTRPRMSGTRQLRHVLQLECLVHFQHSFCKFSFTLMFISIKICCMIC